MAERDVAQVEPELKEPRANPGEDLWQVAFNHRGPWTESDFNAVPEGIGVELHDGLLILTPSPAVEHQFAQQTLAHDLTEAIGDRKRVLQASDVRMADGRRYRTPDVIVVRAPYHGRPAHPENVLLVVEVISPGGGDEWTLKKIAYADAGIPGYLIVQQDEDGFAAFHHVLGEDGAYVLDTEAAAGAVLKVTEPFEFTVDLAELVY